MVTTPQEQEAKKSKKAQVLVDLNVVETSFEKWAKPGHFSRTLAKGPKTTTWIWNLHADAHDFDIQTKSLEEVSRKIFSAHFGQLAIIFLWLSGMHFHGAYFSNYTAWLTNPLQIKPSAQSVYRIVGQEILNADVGGNFQGIQITSGFFQIWRSQGVTTQLQLYCISVGALVMAAAMLFAGWFHYHKAAPKLEWFQNAESMLNHHLSGLLGLGSLAWAGHEIHIGNPINKLLDSGMDPKDLPDPHELLINREYIGSLYPSFKAGLIPFFTLDWSKYSDILTFKGGLNPTTASLWLTDVAHHHLAIAVLFIIAGHQYRTNFGIGHSMKEILEAHKGPFTGNGHKGLYEVLTTSWHAQLAINLAMLGSITIVIAHHMYAMPPYPYIAIDYPTQLSLFTHHMWIGAFCIVGGAAHGSIFMVRDYDATLNYNNLLDRVIRHRDAIISHLNWVSIFLGFHSFGLYIHNDTMQALGRPQDMFSDKAISLQPIFAQWIQGLHSAAPGTTSPNSLATASYIFGGDPVILGSKIALVPMQLGTADFMVHHIHAFTIHVTTLILLKGVLYARNSRLIPDKSNLGFRFPCDGPGRGGTCDISAWDAFYLAMFWMLNTIGWVTFYWHWKHITLWLGNPAQFDESSNYIMGWLRDYLWLNSSPLINGYNPLGMNNLSVWAWMFLFGHLVWATGFMFLISWRGYWQELIETIVWAHERTPLANLVRWKDKPVALSIVQARLVGLAHFTIGYIFTYAPFVIASTLGKFG
jgi:photosystem I P700 chlorophyll a apoprotein A1